MPLHSPALDDFVAAFEKARQADPGADLRAFLPGPQDPLYRPVLRELIRIDLEFGWESNRPRPLEDYASDFPDLFRDPDSVQQITFEEYRLRRQAGDAPSPQEYARRYGVRTDGWPTAAPPVCSDSLLASVQVEQAAHSYRAFRGGPVAGPDDLDGWEPPAAAGDGVAEFFRELHLSDHVLACHFAEGVVNLPSAGGEFAGFRLLRELGRGAFGRVFLARQAALAGRAVALKIAPDVGSESQALAQLQHTHIVPIYSVHRASQLQAVCMPYCGGTTAGDLLRLIAESGTLPTTGAGLLRLLAEHAPPGGPTPGAHHPGARHPAAALTYPEAVLWMGGKLAAALAHAHERGILHRDIKPANVLITDEGLPMLLDFNVSEDVKQRRPSAAMLGGTLPYMAPEQLAAFAGGSLAVDERSDVYSLGIVLFELLTGRFPFSPVRAAGCSDATLGRAVEQMLAERRAAVPCPRRFNPAVSPATAAIVRRALEPDPERRYPSADSLREDVERQLNHQPLKHAPEPSLRERARKWARRHPRTALRLTALALVAAAAAAVAFGWQARASARADEARETLARFNGEFNRAQFLLIGQSPLPDGRARGEEACRRALGLYGVLDGPSWQDRPRVTALPPAEHEALKENVGELLLVLARSLVRFRDAPPDEGLKLALTCNTLAASCFAPEQTPGVLWEQRAELCERLGRTEEAAEARKEGEGRPPTSARSRYLKAADLAGRGDHVGARALLLPAVEVERDRYWALFLLGLCHDALGENTRALVCYTACIARDKGFHAAYLNRAHLLGRMNDVPEAIRDLTRALELEPDLSEAYVDRALMYRRTKEYAKALADLDTAIRKGCPLSRVYFIRSRVRRLAGDLRGADEDVKEGLRQVPSDPRSWVSRAAARMGQDPAGALKDLDEALKLDPRSREALENKAHLYAERLGRPKDAEAVLDKLLSLYPDHAPSLAGLAVVQARLGKRESAHERMGRALSRDLSALLRYQAACVHALTSREKPGDADVAMVHLRRAIDDGFGLNLLEGDRDLDALRERPDFRDLVRAARLLQRRGPAPR